MLISRIKNVFKNVLKSKARFHLDAHLIKRYELKTWHLLSTLN